MMSVVANAGDAKPIAVAAAAYRRSLNADVTIVTTLAVRRNFAAPYILHMRLGIARIPLHFATACAHQTIDDYPGVGTIAKSCPRLQKMAEPFLPAIDCINKRKMLTVYRADLPRTLNLVAALSLAVPAASIVVRAFHSTARRITITANLDRNPFEATITATCRECGREPLITNSIDRIRKVE
jgi:hypothetical protein